jgi:hypothetical protein
MSFIASSNMLKIMSEFYNEAAKGTPLGFFLKSSCFYISRSFDRSWFNVASDH